MILWINLVTDGLCTIPLGLEPRHRAVLRQPPAIRKNRFSTDHVEAHGDLDAVDGHRYSGLFAYELSTGHWSTLVRSPFRRSLRFNGSRRSTHVRSISRSSRWVSSPTVRSLQASRGCCFAAHRCPDGLGNWLFGTVPLSLTHWLWIISSAAQYGLSTNC